MKTKAYIAEFIGTFALAGAVLASINGSVSSIATAMIAALTLGLFVMSVGSVSGTHINPAVTIGLWSVKKIDTTNAIGYIVAQILGAFSAVLIMNMLIEETLKLAPEPTASMSVLLAELVGMVIFTFGISAAVHHKAEGAHAALLVGGSLLLGIIFAAVAGNGVLNPAVASAIGSFNWAYALGPIVGSIIGFNLYRLAITEKGQL